MPNSNRVRRIIAFSYDSPGMGWPQHEFDHTMGQAFFVFARCCNRSSFVCLNKKN